MDHAKHAIEHFRYFPGTTATGTRFPLGYHEISDGCDQVMTCLRVLGRQKLGVSRQVERLLWIQRQLSFGDDKVSLPNSLRLHCPGAVACSCGDS